MLMALMVTAAAVLGWLLARGLAPAAQPGRTAPPDSRLRWVERHPGEVNSGDVERMLMAAGLSPADVRLVSSRASALGIKPFTMWMWSKVHGARALAVTVAAEVPHEQLLEHLAEGTHPGFEELEVLAGLNGLAAATTPAHGAAAGRPPGAERVADGPRPTPVPRSLADLDVREPGDWSPVPRAR